MGKDIPMIVAARKLASSANGKTGGKTHEQHRHRACRRFESSTRGSRSSSRDTLLNVISFLTMLPGLRNFDQNHAYNLTKQGAICLLRCAAISAFLP
jgi:hypothetical protein